MAGTGAWGYSGDGGPAKEAGLGTVSALGAGGTTVLVLKQGEKGCSFVIDGVSDHRPPAPGPVHDVTGARLEHAAGFLLGGPDLAMEVAARCVAQVGAQPHTLLPDSP